MSAFDYIGLAPRLLQKGGRAPLYFEFVTTAGCNARCGHCRFGTDERQNGELSIDELDKISASMGRLLVFSATGGEPFLRTDLAEIVKVFHRNTRPVQVNIPTNGSLTGRVLDGTREILDACPDLDLNLRVSIDDIGQDHDRARGYPGLFEKAIRTYRELKIVEPHFPRLSVSIQITVSGHNHAGLDRLYDYLRACAGVDSVVTVLVRGAPQDPGARYTPRFDPAASRLDISSYEQFNARLEKDRRAGRLGDSRSAPLAAEARAAASICPRVIARMTRERRWEMPCHAGALGGIMHSNGDVFACELLTDKGLGNVRDVDYDFGKLWRSKRAAEVRSWISRSHCYCTHESQLAVNILANPRLYPLLLKERLAPGLGPPARTATRVSPPS